MCVIGINVVSQHESSEPTAFLIELTGTVSAPRTKRELRGEHERTANGKLPLSGSHHMVFWPQFKQQVLHASLVGISIFCGRQRPSPATLKSGGTLRNLRGNARRREHPHGRVPAGSAVPFVSMLCEGRAVSAGVLSALHFRRRRLSYVSVAGLVA